MAHVGKRGKPRKAGRLALCVCVEGETELDYFSGMRAAYRIPKSLLYVSRSGGTAISNLSSWLRDARSGNKRELPDVSYDQFWGVGDTEWKSDWKGYAERPSTGISEKAQVHTHALWAISSASFERWLLFHFEEHPPHQDARSLARRMGGYLPGYSPDSKRLGATEIGVLLPLTEVALENARKWRATNESEDGFTDVDLLVDTIRKHVAMPNALK